MSSLFLDDKVFHVPFSMYIFLTLIWITKLVNNFQHLSDPLNSTTFYPVEGGTKCQL